MISFFIPGLPKPAGSKRAFALKKGGVFTGRVAVVDDCKSSKDWKTDVRITAQKMYPRLAPLAGALSVQLVFHLPRPKAHFGSRFGEARLKDTAPVHPIIRPDVLKLARGVEDALSGIIWNDDAQIVEEHLAKRYSTTPGVHLTVQEADHVPAKTGDAGTALLKL